MNNIFESIFGCRKRAIIKELNASLQRANEKIKRLETANAEFKTNNNKLGLTIKQAETDRMKLARELEAANEGKNKAWEKLEGLRKEIQALESKIQKRGKDGRFLKK